ACTNSVSSTLASSLSITAQRARASPTLARDLICSMANATSSTFIQMKRGARWRASVFRERELTEARRVLIVDDELLSRQRLTRYLQQFDQPLIIEEADSGLKAVE